MAAIPQGAFAAIKMRNDIQLQTSNSVQMGRDKKPTGDGKKYDGQWNKTGSGVGKDWGAFPKLNQQFLEHPPAQYNSKMMNSIWGLYNRYSVHNFKKITGDDAKMGQQQSAADARYTNRYNNEVFGKSCPSVAANNVGNSRSPSGTASCAPGSAKTSSAFTAAWEAFHPH